MYVKEEEEKREKLEERMANWVIEIEGKRREGRQDTKEDKT